MGGVIDPEKGTLLYRKTTQVETVEPGGDQLQRKRVKKVTDETQWIGPHKKKQPLLTPHEEEEEDISQEPWHDEEVEQNPLYSSSDYVSDFNNPLYTQRMSGAGGAAVVGSEPIEMDDIALLGPTKKEKDGGRAARGKLGAGDHGQEYLEYLSAQPGLDEVDTLF